MSYILFFLILLGTMLTYMFFPRSDRFQLEVNREDANIVTFLNQHQAAKDYMYQMSSWKEGDTSNKSPFVFKYADLSKMMPKTMRGIGDEGAINDISENNLPVPEDGSFASSIVCLDTAGALSKCPQDRKYVMTYGYAPNWWSKETEKREVWIKSILKRTHGSAHCGILNAVPPPDGSAYSIFNGQRYSGFEDWVSPAPDSKVYRIIPDSVGDWIDNNFTNENRKVLICMSPFSSPYLGTPIFDIDSLNNTGKGHVESSGAIQRSPLIGTLTASRIGGFTNTNFYTIVGVISSQTAVFMSNESGTPFISMSCDATCTLTADDVSIGNLQPDKPYVFYYTADTAQKMLTVYDPILEKKTITYTERNNEGSIVNKEGNKAVKSWLTTTAKQNTAASELKTNFQILSNWFNGPLLALRIYKGSLNEKAIRHNLNADGKRFGLYKSINAVTEVENP